MPPEQHAEDQTQRHADQADQQRDLGGVHQARPLVAALHVRAEQKQRVLGSVDLRPRRRSGAGPSGMRPNSLYSKPWHEKCARARAASGSATYTRLKSDRIARADQRVDVGLKPARRTRWIGCGAIRPRCASEASGSAYARKSAKSTTR